MNKKARGRHRRPGQPHHLANRALTTAALTVATAAGVIVASGSAGAVEATSSASTQGNTQAKEPGNPAMGGLSPNPNPVTLPAPIDGPGIARGILGLQAGIERIVEKYKTIPENRSGFVKSLRDEVSQASDGYNVMVFNTEGQDYEENLSGGPVEDGQPFMATAAYDGTEYTVWVFKEGTFTQLGDGGYDNWAYSGIYDINSNTLTFHDGTEQLPEQAAIEEPTQQNDTSEQPPEQCGASDGVKLVVEADSLGISQQIQEQVASVCLSDGQEQITQKLRDIIYDAGGGEYNALVFNKNQDYAWQNRSDMPFVATVPVGDKMYGLWLTSSGTFENKGDGGHENWAFAGSYDANGGTITFHNPTGEDAQGGVDASSTEAGKKCITLPFAAAGTTPGASGDSLGIAGQLTDVVATSREDCVKQVAERAFTAAGQQYNVAVINQANAIDNQLNGVKSYVTVQYEGVYFGVWVFESGTVTNNDEGGYSNWALLGNFESSEDGRVATFSSEPAEAEDFWGLSQVEAAQQEPAQEPAPQEPAEAEDFWGLSQVEAAQQEPAQEPAPQEPAEAEDFWG
ncbi:hypothetical protein, partial [Streptomyces chartreusis]|uniref:hypothetical protein n=1 Tax=Streptomyces chartreusis TaxID=1969 RepID=UPI0037FC4915